MTNTGAEKKRQRTIDDMRDFLDFIEANPIVPMPYFGSVNAYPQGGVDIKDVVKALGNVKKSTMPSFFTVTRNFGNLTFGVNFSRSDVCERKVVGTKVIPERIIQEYEIEIIDWICPPSLLAMDCGGDGDEY